MTTTLTATGIRKALPTAGMTGIAACLLLALALPGRALADPDLDRALAEYEQAKAAYQKRLAQIGVKPEDVHFDKKPKGKKAQALGTAIMEYLPFLERAVFRLGGARRVAAERALRNYDMPAMDKQCRMLREKMILLWSPKHTFFRLPFNMRWQALENGSPKVMEYFILQNISADYPNIKKATKEGFVRWLHTRHESMGLDYFLNHGIKLTDYRQDQKGYKVYVMAGNALAFWFYLRSKSSQKVKISAAVSSVGDSLAGIIVNGKSKGKKKSVSVKLQKGMNVVVIMAKNLKEQEFVMRVQVKGKNLECSKRW